MTETPKCPYCGAEMGLKIGEEPKKKWNARFVCGKCLSTGPFVHECQEKSYAEEVALAYTLHRAEPENRPLTLNEVKARCKRPLEADPLFLEFKREGNRCRWMLGTVVKTLEAMELTGDYGKSYRCWPRKPTPEQMAAEKWEE